MSLLDEYPVIRRLIDVCGMPYLDEGQPLPAGPHLYLLPSHQRPNLETPDVAAVLPELLKVFGPVVGGAVAGPALEARLRADLDGIGLPALVVMNGSAIVGAVPRMRDWDDYLARLSALLTPLTAAH